jgi:hypothetical protein
LGVYIYKGFLRNGLEKFFIFNLNFCIMYVCS